MKSRALTSLRKGGLGGCPRCMRGSVASAAASGIVSAIFWTIGIDGILLFASLLVTLAFVGLSLGHLTAASMKALRLAEHREHRTDLSRRSAAASFAGAFGAALLMTVGGSQRAAAQNCQCPPGQWAGYNTYLRQCFCCAIGQTRCFDDKGNWCCAAPGCDCL